MSVSGSSAGSGQSEAIASGAVLRRATRATRLRAAECLVSASARDPGAGQRFLDMAAAHGIDISQLWFRTEQGSERPSEACLLAPGSGRSGMLFTSTPADASGEAALAELIAKVCERSEGVRLAQALLEPGEAPARRSFEMAGFRLVGKLAYMRRRMPGKGEFSAALTRQGWPEGVVARGFVSTDEPGLADLLERTYIDTLDCPELCGLRDTRDVIESHKAAGRFDPKLWWVLELEGRPEGVLLLNPSPEQDTVELVYLGLAPVARGRGLGRRMMELGLGLVAGRPERHVTCAVDERNAPARGLYESLGFERFAQRIALVKPIER
jgi:ribosomal protein S18 acetylase RimI-like enzyme